MHENLSKALMNERFHSSYKANASGWLVAPGSLVARYDGCFRDFLSPVTR